MVVVIVPLQRARISQMAWAMQKTFLESVLYHSQRLLPPPDLDKPENVRQHPGNCLNFSGRLDS